MARRFIARAVLLCSIIVLGASAALAQTAQFTGRVVDSSEGVVPGVTVTATNEENGFLATAVTGADGYYTLSGLGPGKYTIKVELEGFATVQQTGVVLQLGQTARMDFTMQVGAVTDVVDVVGAAPVIQRETTSIGQVIDNTSVTTLPLNGRDYTQLVTLTPGATPNQNSRAADGISLNGARTLQTNYRIDGVDNNNYIMGLDTGSTQALRPSVDSIQEFRVESANFSAQYGNAAGGVVTLAIKSGSNEFKGSAFEFFRDDALDEQEYFSKKSGLAKPPLRYNQFGGTLGGPIVRNRTFFFGSYQGTRNTSSNTLIGTVPTTEMRAGNFGSKAVYDPLTAVGGVRSAFPNNAIPLSRMDPAALKLLALIPQANLSGTVNNYAANAETRDTANQVDVRFDQALGQVSRMFLRYSWQDRDINRAGLFDTDGLGGTAFQNEALLITPTAWSIAGGVTHVLSGTKLNEVRFGFTQNKSGQETPVSEGLFAQYGLGGMPNASALDGLPSIAINNYFRMGSRTFTPNDKRVRIYQFNDTFSWTAGPHGIKFGVEARLKKSMTDSGS
ncbi:MAG: carboxypeptidase regulatory-like domain-containing protein, partial [Acidobacteria bacterium]|nr:carboxypeptidase regulatory-like domain-containing protein [Acidobacteriota bacterium]